MGAAAGTEGVDSCVVGARVSAVGTGAGALAGVVGVEAGAEGVDTCVVGVRVSAVGTGAGALAGVVGAGASSACVLANGGGVLELLLWVLTLVL